VLCLLGAFVGWRCCWHLGIYGVLSHVISQRTREIGVRMALGESQSDIVRATLRYSARITGTGLEIGIVAAIGATRLQPTFFLVFHRSTRSLLMLCR
jgi:ABC-type antimicrobial peptide transport system permease subunit